MKRFLWLVVAITITGFLASCSGKPSVEQNNQGSQQTSREVTAVPSSDAGVPPVADARTPRDDSVPENGARRLPGVERKGRGERLDRGACYETVKAVPVYGAWGAQVVDLETKQPKQFEAGTKLRSLVLSPQQKADRPSASGRQFDPKNLVRALVQGPDDIGFGFVEKSDLKEIDCASVPPHKPRERGPVSGGVG